MKTILPDIKQRRFNDINLPLFFYSYSSNGFPDLIKRMRNSLAYNPKYLLSLYDFEYHLPEGLINSDDSRMRVWDSGGYELLASLSCDNASSSFQWDESTYVRAANSIPWNGYDIVGSFDIPFEDVTIQTQIERAIDLYSRIEGTFFRNLLIHVPFDMNPYNLSDILQPYVNEFHILGVTEKDIAPTWAHGVHFIKRLRKALTTLQTQHYIPIHVFGCFDIKTVVRFTLAGADIFDGLTWLRYFFSNGEVLYKQEYQFAIPISDLLRIDPKLYMMRNNINEMEELRSHLVYAISTNNLDKFSIELSDIHELSRLLN